MQDNSDFASKNFAIYVLGAGFSQPAGLPLGVELWDEVRKRALLLTGRAEHFRIDLEDYIEYRKTSEGKDIALDQVDLEDFMSFLDVEFHLGLRGKDTWSSQGNETQVVVKTLIGQILTERMPAKIPDLYVKFAKILKPDDYVLTFNYDVLLERALEAAGVPFRLYPDRYTSSPFGNGLVVDSSKKEVVVLKLHGSIDWFDRTDYAQLEEDRIKRGFSTPSSDLVFADPMRFGTAPILDGPRFPNDPLLQMYRLRQIERFYRADPLFLATPWLLNPSPMKILYSDRVREFWWGMGGVGGMNFRMAIIGFSLSSHDEYARQAIYRIAKNYQSVHWDLVWDEAGRKKTPVIVIDFKSAPEAEAFKNRYAFLNWGRAQLFLDGFCEKALELFE